MQSVHEAQSKKVKLSKKPKKLKKAIVQRFKIIDEDGDPFENFGDNCKKVKNSDIEEDPSITNYEPVMVLVNNNIDELKMIGKFKTDNWSISSKPDSHKRTRVDSTNSRSRSASIASDSDISVRGRSPKNEPKSSSSRPQSPKRRKTDNHKQSGLAVSGEDDITIKRTEQYKRKKRQPKKELSEEEKKRAQEMKEKYQLWNKGTKQVNDRKQRIDEMAETLEQPFSRYKDDEKLDDHLKNQLFEEDPMFAYMKRKQLAEKGPGRTGETNQAKYRGEAPPNRYSILPGVRWDGVDRSSGFEKKLLSASNVRKANEDEYYAWSSGRFE